jgi:hypothetical protein
MTQVGPEPMSLVFEWAKIFYVLKRAATLISPI